MSGGGSGTASNTIKNSDPWSPAQPYLLGDLSSAANLANQGGPAPYIGPTSVPLTPDQLASQQQQLGYANNVYGGLGTLNGGAAAGAINGLASGNSPLGAIAGQTGTAAGSLNTVATGGGPLSSLTGGGLGSSASSALQQQLSGTPNYDAVNQAVTGANNQVWQNFQNTVLPGINQRASFLNNQSAGVKELNAGIGQVGQTMSNNADQAYLGEYNRAQSAQAAGLGIYGSAGANQSQNVLGADSQILTGAQGLGSQQLQASALYPTLAGAGATPGQLTGQFADTGQQYQQQTLNDLINQYSQVQQQPYSNLNWLTNLVNGTAGLGSTGASTTTNTTNPGLAGHVVGALGGASAGASIGGNLDTSNGTGQGIGALLGALLGGFA